MTPYQAFLYAAGIYMPVPPGMFVQTLQIGGIVFGYARDLKGNTVIVFRGTQNARDLLNDAEALPMDAGPLGMVHTGAYRGMPAVLDALRPLIVGQVVIVGHSLGAMRAGLFAGMCAAVGIPVAQLFMYEPARPGFAQLAELVRAHVPDILGTRNARDFVPDLAPEFPIPYRHIVDLIDLDHPADSLDPADDHLLVQIGPAILQRWPESVSA